VSKIDNVGSLEKSLNLRMQRIRGRRIPTRSGMRLGSAGIVSPIAGRNMLGGVKGRSAARLNSRMSAIGSRSKRPLRMRRSPKMDLFRVNTVKGRMGIVGGRKSGLPLLQKRLSAKIPTMKRRMPGVVSPIKGRDMLKGAKGRSGSMLKSRMASIGLRKMSPLSMRRSPKMNQFRVNTVNGRMGIVNGRSKSLLSSRLVAGNPVVVGNSLLETNLLKRSSLDSRFDRPIIVRNNIGSPLIGGARSKNLISSKVHLGVGMPSLRTGLKSGSLNKMGSLQGRLGAKSMKRQPVQKMPLQKRSFGIDNKRMGKGALNRFALMQR